MKEFPSPIVTVDVVPLAIREGSLCVLLGTRSAEPFGDRLALIGGYVRVDEDATAGAAARRVLREKASIPKLYLEQLSTFSGPDRDPRGWSMSVAYLSVSPLEAITPPTGQDRLRLVPVDETADLPFDHSLIVQAAVRRVRDKAGYSDLPARLLPDEFTMRELHDAYQIAMDEEFNADAFRRKILERGFIEPVPETSTIRASPMRPAPDRRRGGHRPAQIYRMKSGQALFDRRF